jgi:hypothetical protein
MTRTSFELEFEASNLQAAKAIAESRVATYLNVDSEEVPRLADMEFKVKTNSDGVDRTHVYVTNKRTISSH